VSLTNEESKALICSRSLVPIYNL